MKKAVLLLISFLTIFSAASAQKEGLAAIGKSDLRAYMEFFAYDYMGGRETGTPENDISALFLRSTLVRLGLKPAHITGDYLQKIPLFSTKIDKNNTFLKLVNSNGETIMSTDSVLSIMPPAKSMEVSGNVVFAGYGYENRNTGYNDFEGIDIKGKIVMIMTRYPEAVASGS